MDTLLVIILLLLLFGGGGGLYWGMGAETPREPGQILLQLTERSVMPEFSFRPELPTN